MKYNIKTLLALTLLLAVITPAQAGTKIIGEVNGLKIVRIRTASLFAPSQTTIVAFDPKKPGTIEAVLNQTGGPGFVPAVATAGGIVGGAALLRPAKTSVNTTTTVSGTGGNGGAGGNGGVANGGGAGHQNGSIHHND